jgi:hypothetical protein
MKLFIQETQGVPKNSQKWFELRNKHYQILSQIYKEQEASKTIESFDYSFLRFYLIIVPEDPKCYELLSILNYFGLQYKALEDSPVSKIILKQMLGLFTKENYKNCNYPFLIFESSEEPKQNVDGFDNIMQFLIENKFIHDYRSHSVYEKEGVKFALEFEKIFEDEFKKWTNCYSFYFRTTNFKEARYFYNPYIDGYVYRSRILSRLYRLFKHLFKNFSFRKFFKNLYSLPSRIKAVYKKPDRKKILLEAENYKKLINLLDEWILRLNNNPFHGGDIPDEADFKLYSLIKKFTQCRNIHYAFKRIQNLKFDDWVSRMSLLCTRSSYYNIREPGYFYNDKIDKNILEEEKINKKEIKSNPDVKGAFSGNRIRRNKINI